LADNSGLFFLKEEKFLSYSLNAFDPFLFNDILKVMRYPLRVLAYKVDVDSAQMSQEIAQSGH
jgi:hypothetical protein